MVGQLVVTGGGATGGMLVYVDGAGGVNESSPGFLLCVDPVVLARGGMPLSSSTSFSSWLCSLQTPVTFHPPPGWGCIFARHGHPVMRVA
jgi:hypothetical protein